MSIVRGRLSDLFDDFVNYTYVPTSRWQKLKRDYAPFWFLSWFPVKVRRVPRPAEYKPFVKEGPHEGS